MNALLKEKLNVERSINSKNDIGEIIQNFSLIEENVPCKVYVTQGLLNQYESGRKIVAVYIAMVPNSSDIREGDRIIHSSNRYIVTFVEPSIGFKKVTMDRE